jgi:hypothetical protein
MADWTNAAGILLTLWQVPTDHFMSLQTMTENPPRCLVLIASTMRSGSTLLKALLGEAPDVSNLSEVNFQRFASPAPNWDRMWALAPERILVLKRPGWYHEIGRYPRIPELPSGSGGPTKVLALVRDVYDTVESLRKMTFGPLQSWVRPASDRWLAERYWTGINRALFKLAREGGDDCRLVRYEDLVARPLEVTAELFRWMGSDQSVGVDTYREPSEGRWRWGRDDNSNTIRSRRVQPPSKRQHQNQALDALIQSSDAIRQLRQDLGYLEN